MQVTLTQLETFVLLADEKNFSRVAERLHLTQPAVSQQVHALERTLGVRLVDLVGRRAQLTEAGLFLATRARTLLDGMGLLEQEMVAFANARLGCLTVGATLTIGAYVLPGLLAQFGTRHPQLSIKVEIANTAEIVERVRAGSLPLALVEGPLDGDDVEVQPFQRDRLVLVAFPAHRFAAAGHIAPDALDGEPMVWRERGSGTRALAEDALAGLGVSPRVVLELPTGEGVARAVEAGIGLAFLSQLVVEQAIHDGRLIAVALDGLDLSRTFRLVLPRGRTHSPATIAFTTMLGQHLA